MPTVNISNKMIRRCFNFSERIIIGNNQYNRLPTTINKRIERTFVGKLAEYAFLNYLHSINIQYDEGDMFTIYEGQENTDGFDFITSNGETIDIKSASKPFHSKIMVPIDQFIGSPKDFYVGVKLNSEINDNGLIISETITLATIHGYCTYKMLQNRNPRNFGEGLCRYSELNDLNNIDYLIDKF